MLGGVRNIDFFVLGKLFFAHIFFVFVCWVEGILISCGEDKKILFFFSVSFFSFCVPGGRNIDLFCYFFLFYVLGGQSINLLSREEQKLLFFDKINCFIFFVCWGDNILIWFVLGKQKI